MVEPGFKLELQKGAWPLQVKSTYDQWKKSRSKAGEDAFLNSVRKAYYEGGCISADALVKALMAKAGKGLDLVVIDLRRLGFEGDEGNIKIGGAVNCSMAKDDVLLSDFDKFKADIKWLFPEDHGHLPEAIVFYCTSGVNRSPIMAIAYTLWMHQQFNKDGKSKVPSCCYLEKGYGSFVSTNMNITIGDAWGLLEKVSEKKKNTLPVSNIRQVNKPSNK